MTAPLRTLSLLVAGLALGPTPACLHISGTVSPVEPGPTRPTNSGEFATLPRVPGKVVPINPTGRATASVTQQPPDPVVPSEGDAPAPRPAGQTTTSQRPLPPTLPASPDEAAVPAPPTSDLVPVKAAEPGPIPLLAPPPSAEAPLLAAVRAYVENRPEEALRHLQGLDRPNQEFALAVLPLLVRGSQVDFGRPDAADMGVLVDQFNGLTAQLERKAALRVDRVAFCKKVVGFGRYDPWPEAQPYKPNDLAVLYVEVRNVGSEPAAGPNGEGYVSRAAISLEVRDATGKLVEQTDPADWRRRVPVARFEHADHTRSPLRDYSRSYRISVPTQPGVYTVTVEVRDPAGTRVARSQPVRFDVGGP